ncbi:MAG: DUF2690 domain-containing protein [Anaerolineales bacterium]
MKTLKFFLTFFAVLGVLSAIALPAPAFAAHLASPGCFGTTCNFKDPIAMGCDADAYTVSQAEIPGVVRAAVRYSPTCQAAWARGVNETTVSGRTINAEILRSDGSFSSRLAYYPTTAITSLMLYVGSNTVKAYATLQESNGQIVNTVATGFVHP